MQYRLSNRLVMAWSKRKNQESGILLWAYRGAQLSKTHPKVCAHKNIRLYMYTYMYIYKYIYVYICICMPAYGVRIDRCTHVHTCKDTHLNTYLLSIVEGCDCVVSQQTPIVQV